MGDVGVFAALEGEAGEFGFEFSETGEAGGVEGALLEGFEDGTTGFAGVGAGAQVTADSQFGDFGKSLGQSAIGDPQVEFAEAGGVDDQSAAGEEDEFAPGGGVTSFAVLFPDFEGGLDGLAVQAVDQTGFADPGRADEGAGATVGQATTQFAEAASGAGADGEEGGVGTGHLTGFGEGGVEVGAEIGFIEHDHRAGATFQGHDEEAFEAPRSDGEVEAMDDEGDIDIGGEDLGGGFATGDFAGERGASGEDLLDDGTAIAGFLAEGDPIADLGEGMAGVGFLEETTGDAGDAFAVAGDHGVTLAVLHGHAAGLKGLGIASLLAKGAFPGVIPTECMQVHHADKIEWQA